MGNDLYVPLKWKANWLNEGLRDLGWVHAKNKLLQNYFMFPMNRKKQFFEAMSENLTEIMTSLDLRDVVKWRVSGHRMTIEWSTTFGLPKFKIVVSTFMENFFETVVKLTGAVALLSTAGNQHQATLAMMTIKPLHLENNHYGDDYWGEGQEIEDLWLSPYGSKTPYASSFTESYDCSKRDMQINKRKLHCSEGRRTDHWCTPYWPCLCGINDGSLKTANW